MEEWNRCLRSDCSECDDWVFIPGELGGMPCEKLLLKSVKLVKCPASRELKIKSSHSCDFRLGSFFEYIKYRLRLFGLFLYVSA